MRIFVAGAAGVIGSRVVPLLVRAGHTVIGTTRSPAGAEKVRALGAEPVVCDVYDLPALTAAVVGAAPDLVLHELTDLPDDREKLAARRGDNARIRREGTANLLAAAAASGRPRVVAQSVAWELPPGDGADAVATLEQAVLAVGGVVLRYGQLHGPGTYYPTGLPTGPGVHVDTAAARTAEVVEQELRLVAADATAQAPRTSEGRVLTVVDTDLSSW